MTDFEKIKHKRAMKWVSNMKALSKYDLDDIFLSIFKQEEMKKCKDCNEVLTLCDCRDNPKWQKIAKGKSERYPLIQQKRKEKDKK